MKTFYMIVLLTALVLIVVGVACLSYVLPSWLALAPYAAMCVAGWCVADAVSEIWKS